MLSLGKGRGEVKQGVLSEKQETPVWKSTIPGKFLSRARGVDADAETLLPPLPDDASSEHIDDPQEPQKRPYRRCCRSCGTLHCL